MKTLVIIYTLISFMFMFLNHPLSMGLIILLQTLLTSLMMMNLSPNFWFSYIILLMMIGGMLVLFIYMTSIASNEKFKINTKLMLIILLTIPITMMNLDLSLMNSESMKELLILNLMSSLSKFIKFPSNLIIMFLMIYMFMTLIATVKISKSKMGPLRQMK